MVFLGLLEEATQWVSGETVMCAQESGVTAEPYQENTQVGSFWAPTKELECGRAEVDRTVTAWTPNADGFQRP